MKKICLIGQFPPPIHGLSKALNTIVESKEINKKYDLEVIDIKDNKKFINHINKINKSNANLYYFTIAQTKFGNLRDMIILRQILKRNKKVIIHYHGGYYKKLYDSMNFLQKKINKMYISKIDIMIALSKSLKSLFVDVIESTKIRVCENYVENTSLIDEIEFNQKVENVTEKEVIDILYLSNFIKTKGYFDVLTAANKLKKEKVSFHFAGSFFNEEEKEEFFQYIKQKDLHDIVKYYGTVQGEEKKELLKKCDIFVLPTYYPNEGQPISIIEAMGNGLTIITTDHAGIPDIVNHDNGYIIHPQSPDEVASSIQAVLTDKKKIKYFAENNRKITLERFKEIDYTKRLELIFDEVLKDEN